MSLANDKATIVIENTTEALQEFNKQLKLITSSEAWGILMAYTPSKNETKEYRRQLARRKRIARGAKKRNLR